MKMRATALMSMGWTYRWGKNMNEAVQRWKLQGRVYLWRYTGNARNFPGWHMNADSSACTSMMQLIDLMMSSSFTSKATLSLALPADVQLDVPNAPLKHRAATSLEILHSPRTMRYEHWLLTESGDQIHMELGREELGQFRKGIIDITHHEGDYCIGLDGQELWFWWSSLEGQPGHFRPR